MLAQYAEGRSEGFAAWFIMGSAAIRLKGNIIAENDQ
jgi:hypothetical protein